MGMICKQGDGLAVPWGYHHRVVSRTGGLISVDITVKLYQMQRLILDICEEVVVANEVEDAWPSELEEEWQRSAGLSIHHVAIMSKY